MRWFEWLFVLGIAMLMVGLVVCAALPSKLPEPLNCYEVTVEGKRKELVWAHRWVVGSGGEAGFYTDGRLICAYSKFVKVQKVEHGSR